MCQCLLSSSALSQLFIGNIPAGTPEDDLRMLFEPFGEIIDLVILQDRFTKVQRGQSHSHGAPLAHPFKVSRQPAIAHRLILSLSLCAVTTGCGFVVFAYKHSADAAIAALADQARLGHAERELIVRYAGPRPPEEYGQSQRTRSSVCSASDGVACD
jgi:RNA recognition motif-containing protein